MPVARISSITRPASTSPASSARGAVATFGAEALRAVQVPLRAARRGVAPHRRIVEHDRHAVRHERLARRDNRARGNRARAPTPRTTSPCGRWQPAALNAMPASIAAYIISVRASMSDASLTARTRNLPTPLSASAASVSENGLAPCDTGRADAARRDSSRRGQASRGQRFERVAHAVEAARRDDVLRQRRGDARIDQRDASESGAAR